MATATQALDSAASSQLTWAQRLRAELAPTPGRLNATVRIVVSATIVLVTSLTLSVPVVGLSLLVVLLLTKQNSILTAIAGIQGVVAATLAVAITILILRATIDYPLLRFATMALALFIGMYASRVFALGPAVFLFAFVLLLGEADVDLAPGQPELILRAALWAWVAVVYPAAVTTVVNLLLLPADPEPILRREAAARLRVVALVLRARPTSEEARSGAAALAAFATVGSTPLLKLVRFAEIRDSALQPLHAERTAKILLLERLIESAALLPDLAIEPTPDQRSRLERVAAACESLAASLGRDVRWASLPPFPRLPEDAASSALTPVLAELERLVHELPLAERPAVGQPASGRRLFVADAFTNPRYTRFALKVTLAAMFCYTAYTAVDWNGIHTCMVTCAVVALGSAVASIHKATLRIVGCAIGGTVALASIVFLIPQMTSIVPLALLVAAVTAPSAWIATGSQRISYMGVQIAFAFYLAVLEGDAPSTSVTEFRDRIVGIVFGVIVMAVVFSYVWPDRAGTGMVRSLAEALRSMAQLGIGPGAVAPGAGALRAATWHALDEASQMSDLEEFEPEAHTDAGAATAARVRKLIDLTRRTLLAYSALIEQRETGHPTAMDPVEDGARALFDRAIADTLERVANRVETGVSSEPTDMRAPLDALKLKRPSTPEAAGMFDGEIALCDVLVDRVEALQRAAASA